MLRHDPQWKAITPGSTEPGFFTLRSNAFYVILYRYNTIIFLKFQEGSGNAYQGIK